MAMRLSLPPAENASDLLSGDQNLNVPPSVPGSGRAVNVSSGRSHSTLVSRDAPAPNTTYRPSGEGVVAVGPLLNCVPGGVRARTALDAPAFLQWTGIDRIESELGQGAG